MKKVKKISSSMDMIDISDRANGLKEGQVNKEELNYAREILKTEKGEIVLAISTVGLCGNTSDEELLRKYLFGEMSGVYGEFALVALCRYAGLVDKYRDFIKSLIFSNEESHEYIGHIKLAAIHLLPEYMNEYKDDDIVCRVCEIMLDTGSEYRISARYALVRYFNLYDYRNNPTIYIRILGDNFDERDTKHIVELANARHGCCLFERKDSAKN